MYLKVHVNSSSDIHMQQSFLICFSIFSFFLHLLFFLYLCKLSVSYFDNLPDRSIIISEITHCPSRRKTTPVILIVGRKYIPKCAFLITFNLSGVRLSVYLSVYLSENFILHFRFLFMNRLAIFN